MALEYNVRGLNFDVAARAISDSLFKYAQLESKRRQELQTSIDKERRLYNGKVREQDVAVFDSAFQEYENAAKIYNSLNRRGGPKFKKAAQDLTQARKNMVDVAERSSKWGGELINMEKARRDSKKMVEQKKYLSYVGDLYNKNMKELDAKYKDPESAPKLDEFEWKMENQKGTLKDISNWVKSTVKVDGSSFIRKMPSLDDQGNIKTKPIEIPGIKGDPMQVRMMKYEYGANPENVLMSIVSGGVNEDWKELYDNTFKSFTNMASDTSNPSLQKFAIEEISRAAKTYNIPTANVRGEHLIAMNFIDSQMNGVSEMEDWDDLNKQLSIKLKGLGLESKQLDIVKKIQENQQGFSFTELNKILTSLSSIRATGALYIPGMSSIINQVFGPRGIQVTEATLNDAYNKSGANIEMLKTGTQTGGFLDQLIDMKIKAAMGQMQGFKPKE